MSTKTVDQRVVEMRFDNRNFEKNVSTTMSSLDKLKQKLNFKGVTKGFENIDSASKKVNMNGLAGAVDTVRSRFSAMEIIGVTALANITNSAVNAGKRIVSALTIDPVKTGFSEYETQINAIQTILANTSSKGTTLEDVNSALDTLNTYADKTIYNFTEMTRNIGTFTAAGVDLNTSVNAIQGIANLAAVSGSTSQQASTAMYQLSQALASGTVKLMDWNSVVNAGMGGEVFQNALKETARVHGVAIDEIIEKNGSFRDSLHEEWLTTDILTETLEKFTMATEGMSEAEIEANKQKLKSIGYTEKQIEEIFELGNTATNAATKVKTFSQLWDTLKESAQSGWTQTWEIIVGDFEEAKSFLTTLSEGIGGFINKMSDWRNNLLEGALGSKWGQLTAKINGAGISTDKFNEKLKKVAEDNGIAVDDLIKEYGSLEGAMSSGKISTDLITKALRLFSDEAASSKQNTEELNEKLEYFQTVVRKVWHGDYGNMEDRYNALTKAGYDYHEVQALVNKTVDGHALTLEDLTDAQLVSIGCTEEQIKAYRELAEEAEKTGTPLNELIKNLERPSGRTLLIESLKNAAQGLVKSFTAIKDAWVEIFPPMTSDQLYNIIVRLNEFSKHLRMGDETADKLKRTFKGLFAIFDIILTIIGGPLRLAFKAILDILGLADIPILDLTARIGDAIVKLRDWIDEHNIFTIALKKVIPHIQKFAEGIRDLIVGFKDSKGIGKDVIAGLAKGIWNGLKDVGRAALEIGKKIVNTVKEFLGIHSPSTVFMAIGGFIIAGLILGLIGSSGNLWNTITSIAATAVDRFKEGGTLIWTLGKTIVTKLTEIFSSLSLEKVLAIGLGVGIFLAMFKFLSVLGNIAKAAAGVVDGIGDMLEGLGDMFTGAGKMFKGIGRLFTSLAIVNVVIAIGLLVQALMTIVKSGATAGQLFIAVGVIATLGILLTALYFVLGKIDDVGSVSLKSTLALIAITGSLLALSIVLSKLAKIDLESTGPALALLAGILVIMVGVMAIMGKLDGAGGQARKVGRTMLAISVAMLVMVATAKIASKMSVGDIVKGVAVVAAFTGLVSALIAVSKIAGEHAKNAGKMILKMSVAMLIMVAVVKLASMIPEDEVKRGMSVILLIGGIFTAILAVSRLAGQNAAKAGSSVLMMSVAMLAMVGIMKIAAGMSPKDIRRGMVVMAGMTGLFIALMAASKIAGENAAKAGVMLLAASGAMLVMLAVTFLFSQIKTEDLVKGLSAVAILGAIFAGLIAVTKLAKGKEILSTLIMLTVVVALLGGLAIGMSFINPMRLSAAVGAMTIMIAAFAGLIVATKFIGAMSKQAFGSLLAMILIVSLLTGIVAILSKIDVGPAVPNAAALAILVTAMSIALVPLTLFGSGYKRAVKGMVALAAMVVPLAAIGLVIAMMSGLKVQNAIPNVIALSVLMTMMTALLIPLTLFGSGYSRALKGIVALTAMVVPLAMVGLVLAMMSAMKVQDAIPNVIALSVLMTLMTALLIPLTTIGMLGPTALWGVLALAAMAAPLALVGLVLAMMSAMKVQDAIPNVKALSILLTVMTALLIPLTVIGLLGPAAMLGVGALTMMAIPLAAAVLVLAMMNGLGVTDAIDNVKALSILLTVMTALLIPLTLVGAAAPLAIAGIGTLITFITAIGAFMVAVGAITTWIPKIEEFMDKGVQVLVKLAGGIGSIIGAFVGGIAAGLASQLPTIGAYLSAFMVSIRYFIDTVSDVGEDVLKGTGYITAAIALLTASAFLNNAMTFTQKGTSLPLLGAQLSAFMTGAQGFIKGAEKLKPELVNGVKTLAEAMLILTAADLLEGIKSFFGAGGSALASFGAQLPQLGADLGKFSESLTAAGLDESKIKMVEMASSVIKMISEAARDIPNQGGLLGAIVGNNNLGVFADQFPKLGTGLRNFITNIGTFADTELTTVDNACTAITSIATAAKDIPNQGGLLGLLAGENTLSLFASQFPQLAVGLRGFLDNIGTFGKDQLETVKTAASAVAELASVSSKIPNAGGLLGAIVGNNDLSTFAAQFPNVAIGIRDFIRYIGALPEDAETRLSFATGVIRDLIGLANDVPNMGGLLGAIVGNSDLQNFATQFPNVGIGVRQFINKIGELTTSEVSSVENAIKIVDTVTDLSNVDGKTLKKNVSSIGDALVSFGKDVSGFTKAMSAKGIAGTLKDSAAGVRDLVNALATITADMAANLKTVSTALKDLGTGGLKAFTEAFSGSVATKTVQDAADKMVNRFVKGVESKANDIVEVFSKAAESAYSRLTRQELYNEFESAGRFLANGFASGISMNAYKAINAAEAMVTAVNRKICAVALINSPSKMTYEDGMFMVQGLVNALLDGTEGVDAAAEELANSATSGLTKAISRVSDMIQNGIDTQPTIRPVLDLSDVRAGASQIGGMLSLSPSVGVLSNVRSIASAMGKRGQNGANEGVISELGKLRKDIAGLKHVSYNIEGINYGEGSEVAEAIETLVRAALMERRK